jgi:hypothetical protein
MSPQTQCKRSRGNNKRKHQKKNAGAKKDIKAPAFHKTLESDGGDILSREFGQANHVWGIHVITLLP